jgi:TPR repeat protein
MGAELKQFYLVTGQYDIVALVETPDDETMAELALSLCSKGNVHTETLRAFTEEDYSAEECFDEAEKINSEDGSDEAFQLSWPWYFEAAKKGLPEAQTYIGRQYLLGENIQKDYSLALLYLKRTASADHRAIYLLGLMAEEGYGMAKNYDLALKYYRDADSEGNPIASSAIVKLQKKMQG